MFCNYAKSILIAFILILMPFGIQARPYYEPIVIPDDATLLKRFNLMKFNDEVKLARQLGQEGDFYGKTDHLIEALKYRPNDPDNINIEFEIGITMSQYRKKGDSRPMRIEEARTHFKNIVENYNHMDYYEKEHIYVQSSHRQAVMVPRACIFLTSGALVRDDNFAEGRKYTVKALDCLYETFNKRQQDWLNEKKPESSATDEKLIKIFGWDKNEIQETLNRKIEYWQDRQEKARNGDLFCMSETICIQICVRNYGVSAGKDQTIADVIISMNELIERYPGSPIAEVAASYIENAKKIELDKLDESIFDDSLFEMPDKPVVRGVPQTLGNETVSSCKSLFIPNMTEAKKVGKPFVFSASQDMLLGLTQEIDSKAAVTELEVNGKGGELAWDGCLITLLKTKVIPEKNQKMSLRKQSRQWADQFFLPDGIVCPYPFIIKTSDSNYYLINIDSKDETGIRISYRRLHENELELFIEEM